MRCWCNMLHFAQSKLIFPLYAALGSIYGVAAGAGSLHRDVYVCARTRVRGFARAVCPCLCVRVCALSVSASARAPAPARARVHARVYRCVRLIINRHVAGGPALQSRRRTRKAFCARLDARVDSRRRRHRGDVAIRLVRHQRARGARRRVADRPVTSFLLPFFSLRGQ